MTCMANFSIVSPGCVSLSRTSMDRVLSDTTPLRRLHTLPPPVGPDEESHIASMDRRTSFGIGYAAHCRGDGGQIHVQMGTETALYGRRRHHRWILPLDLRVDG